MAVTRSMTRVVRSVRSHDRWSACRLVYALALALVPALVSVSGCGRDVSTPRWTCPAGWVRTSVGACGPRLLVCTSDGGAAADACAGDPGDAGPASAQLPDGALVGRWLPAGSPGGPPDPVSVRAGMTELPDDRTEPVAGVSGCPTGWTLSDRACDPALNAMCPMRAATLPGGRCTDTGDDRCGAALFPTTPADAVGRTVAHVSAAADPGVADGSAMRPYASIGTALTATGLRSVLLVAAGTYRENLAVTMDTYIVGTCPRDVVVVGGSSAPTINVSGAGRIVLHDVEIRGGQIGMALRAGTTAAARNVRWFQSGAPAVWVAGRGATATLDDVYITDTRATGAIGHGLHAEGGASVVARRVVVERSRQIGVYVGTAATIELSDTVVRDTQPRTTDSLFGFGVAVETGGRATMDRIVLDQNNETGLRVVGAGATAIVRDAVIARTAAGMSRLFGGAVSALEGGRAELRRVTAHTLSSPAIVAGDSGTVDISESTVRSVNAVGTTAGIGLVAQGGQMTARGVLIDGVEGVGVLVRDARGELRCDHCVVRGVRLAPNEFGGFSFDVESGGSLELLDSSVRGGTYGLRAIGASTRAVVSRSRLAGTTALGTRVPTTGIVAGQGASVEMDRVHVFDWNYVSALVDETGSTLQAVDSLFRGDPRAGADAPAGLAVQAGASLQLTRSTVMSMTGLGVRASGEGSTAQLSACVVDGTVDDGLRIATGLAATRGAHLTATNSIVRETTGAGALSQDRGSVVTLDGVWVEGVRPGRAWHGYGILASLGARLNANDVVVHRAVGHGGYCRGVESTFSLVNTWFVDVGSTQSALGFGIDAMAGCRLTGDRVAISGSAGGALIAEADPSAALDAPNAAVVTISDLYVQRVQTSALYAQWDEDARTLTPLGSPAAYGVHTAGAGTIRLTRASVVGGGRGVFADGGVVEINLGVISEQLDGFAATGNGAPRARVTMVSVSSVRNASDAISQLQLPSVAQLPPPTAVCESLRCP